MLQDQGNKTHTSFQLFLQSFKSLLESNTKLKPSSGYFDKFPRQQMIKDGVKVGWGEKKSKKLTQKACLEVKKRSNG